MRLFFGKINRYTYIDPASGYVSAAEFRFMSCQNNTDTHTNGKTLSGRRECVFWGKVKKG